MADSNEGVTIHDEIILARSDSSMADSNAK